MWTIGSTTAILASTFADIGTVMAYVIPAVLTVAVALVGLGFGWSKFKRYVTGGKF